MGTKIILIVIALISFNSFSQTLENPIPQIDFNLLDGVWYKQKNNDLIYYVSGKNQPLEYLEKLVTSNGGDFKNPSLDSIFEGVRYRKFNLANGESIVFSNDKFGSGITWNK